MATAICFASFAACKGAGGGGPVAVYAQGNFSPSSLSFPGVPIGDPEVLTASLGDVSDVDLNLGTPVVTGDFTLLTKLPSTLSANGTLTVQVQFMPTASGARSGTVTVPTPGAQNPQVSLMLSGQGIEPTGVQLRVTPATIRFDTLLLGETAAEEIQVFNPNNFNVTAFINLDERDPRPQFALAAPQLIPVADGGFNALLTPQQALGLSVTFAPSLVQSSMATVRVAACPTCSPTPVALSGTGIDAHLTFNPPHLDFGFVPNDPNPLPTLPVTVANDGNLELTLVHLDIPANSPFRLVNGPADGTQLAPDGGGVPFSVTYSPSAAPSDTSGVTATWTVLPPGSSTLLTRHTYLPLAGNEALGGCKLRVVQDAGIDFGSLMPGASLTEELQFLNVGGDNCLVQVELDPTSSTAFSLSSPAAGGGSSDGGWVVYAHGETDFAVTFLTAADAHHLTYRGALDVQQLGAQGDAGLPGRLPLTAALATGYASHSVWPKWGHENANSGQGDVDTSQLQGTLLWRTSLPAAPAVPPLVSVDAGIGSYNWGVGQIPYQPIVGGVSVGPVIADNGMVLQLAAPYWESLYGLSPADGGVAVWFGLGAPSAMGLGGLYGNPYLPPPNIMTGLGMESPVVASNGLVLLTTPLNGNPGNYTIWPSGELWYLSLESGELVPLTVQKSSGDNCSVASGGYCVLANTPPVLLPGEDEFTTTLAGDFTSQVTELYTLPLLTTQLVVGPPTVSVTEYLPSMGLPSPAVDANNDLYYCGQRPSAKGNFGPKPDGIPSGCASVDATRSRVNWQLDFGPNFVSAPVLGSGALFVSLFQEASVSVAGHNPEFQYQCSVEALDPSSGAVLWQYHLPTLPVLPTGRAPNLDAGIPALDFHPDYFAQQNLQLGLGDDGALVIPYVDGIYCLEATGPNQGTLRWRTPVPGGSFSAASFGLEGTIYIGTVSQGLLALDNKTGSVLWSYRLPASAPPAIDAEGNVVQSITARPAIGDGVIYIAGDDNYVYAIQ